MPIERRKEMLYLDNGATSYPKPEAVIDSYAKYLREVGASPSRGGYETAITAGRKVFETRMNISKLFGSSNPERIIFTKNATEALNLAIFGLLSDGDSVVTTRMEHNAVIRPLLQLEREGKIKIHWAKLTDRGRLDIEHLFELISSNKVKLVITTGMANVTGVVVPFWEIGKFCRERDILYLVDGAQLAGSYPVNVEEDFIDLLAFTGHKSLYGVPGTGGLYIGDRAEKHIKPLIWGGTGGYSELPDMPDLIPDKYEAGTPNTPGIVALGEGVRWLLEKGVESIHLHKRELLRIVLDGLKKIDGVNLFGPDDDVDRSSTIPFTIDGIKPQKIAQLLWNRYKIAIRAGLHCAPHIHQDLGAPDGTARLSFGAFNTKEDAEYAIAAVEEIAKEQK